MEKRVELEASIASLKSQLSTSEANRLAQAESELQRSGGGVRIQELEATLEDVRRELSEKEDLVVEAWKKVDSINTDLTKHKEKVEFLRTRMLTQQPPVVTQLSVCAQSPSKAEFRVTVSALRSPASATGTPAAKIFKRTLSQPPSAAKSSAGILPSATSKTKTTKRSLFSQPRSRSPSTRSRGGTVNEATSTTSLEGAMTRNRRTRSSSRTSGPGSEPVVHTKVATPKQRTLPVPHSQVSAADKENVGETSQADAAEKRKAQESPQIRPNTRTRKQLALGLSPFGRDSSNIRPRTESTMSSRARPQRVQQLKQQATVEKAAPARSAVPAAAAAAATASAPSPKTSGAPSGVALKSATGVMTRAQRASAGKAKTAPKAEGKTDEQGDCKMQ
ncbi:hypothetical protein MTO96_023316 [Rhipicephalus appendiculatus]